MKARAAEHTHTHPRAARHTHGQQNHGGRRISPLPQRAGRETASGPGQRNASVPGLPQPGDAIQSDYRASYLAWST